MKKLWKVIHFSPDYEISENGEIRRLTAPRGFCRNTYKGKVRKTSRDTYGYPSVCLMVDGKPKTYNIHKIVALVFHGEPPFPKADVAHLDGSVDNNHYSNLIWCSRKENLSHALAQNTFQRGEKHYKTKLSNNDIFAIRDSHLSNKDIAALYSISKNTVWQIKARKRWAHI